MHPMGNIVHKECAFKQSESHYGLLVGWRGVVYTNGVEDRHRIYKCDGCKQQTNQREQCADTNVEAYVYLGQHYIFEEQNQNKVSTTNTHDWHIIC